jgi:replicative DNA helicase
MQILLHSSIARNTTRILEDESGQSLKGIAEFIVAKHRHGALDTVRMRFLEYLRQIRQSRRFCGDNPLAGPFQPTVVTRPSKMNDEDIPF